MTSVFQLVKSKQLQARKDRAKVEADLLTTLIGEIQRGDTQTTEVTDQRVFSAASKMLAGIETIHKLNNSMQSVVEMSVLKEILAMQPAAATDEEIVAALTNAKESGIPINIGSLMKHLKSQFPVLDGARASVLIKHFIG